jgi:predicted kinase
MPAIRIRSDIVRKQLHQVGELESSGSAVGKGLYDPDITAKIYGTLARFAAIALTAGYDVIVDATFLHRADRASLQTIAVNCTARFAILDCTADDRILTERVEKRRAAGHDASEADLAVLDWQRANLEPLSEEEQRHTLTVDTGRHSAVDEITRRLRKISAEV